MDITLTLSPITPLDVQFDTPSPSPPILGYPIPWNMVASDDLRDALSVIFGLSELKEPRLDHRSTAAVNDGSDGQRRRSTTVNGGEPPLTGGRPQLDHRRTTALSPGYIADFDSEEDEEDPEEDPADYHVDGGDNDDNESSDYDDDDDDVEKDEEDEEEDEHLALTDPSAVPTDDYVPLS
ncbi:hypothetical protein Tco_1158822 [Tanacetum coccineum]